MSLSKPVVEVLGNSIESWLLHAARLHLGGLAGAMGYQGVAGDDQLHLPRDSHSLKLRELRSSLGTGSQMQYIL